MSGLVPPEWESGPAGHCGVPGCDSQMRSQPVQTQSAAAAQKKSPGCIAGCGALSAPGVLAPAKWGTPEPLFQHPTFLDIGGKGEGARAPPHLRPDSTVVDFDRTERVKRGWSWWPPCAAHVWACPLQHSFQRSQPWRAALPHGRFGFPRLRLEVKWGNWWGSD